MKKVLYIFILFSIIVFITACDDYELYINDNINQNDPIMESNILIIDLKGEINRSGIYEIKSGTFLYELIELAGGLTSSADLSKINLALRLTNESMIVIPKIQNIQTFEDEKININTATINDLKTLEKIGDVLASRIIEYRETNGYYKNIEELKNIKGLSDGVFNKIRDFITV